MVRDLILDAGGNTEGTRIVIFSFRNPSIKLSASLLIAINKPPSSSITTASTKDPSLKITFSGLSVQTELVFPKIYRYLPVI